MSTRTLIPDSTGTSRARAYRPLPVCDPQQAGEMMQEYGARVLRFLLAEQVTATLDDEQLAQADCAACRALSQVWGDDPKASRSKLGVAELLTLDKLTSARHLIAKVLAWRASEHRYASLAPAGGTIYPVGGSQHGRPASLQPVPPSLPPSGQQLPQPSSPRRPADAIRF